MIQRIHLPSRNLDTISQNTANILEGVKRQLQVQSDISPDAIPVTDEKIEFGEAISSKKFVSYGLGVYKESKQEDGDYGKIWIKKSIMNEKTGKSEDWLVVYTNDNDEIIRQIAMEKTAELESKSWELQDENKHIDILHHNISYYYDNGIDMPEQEEEHVKEMIMEGYSSGELNYFDPITDEEIRGWWSIEKNASKTAAPVKPENVPLAPGIKSKNLTLDEGGASGTGKVTVEFTDVSKALDFYQNEVATSGENKETPKEEEAPQDQNTQQATPPPPPVQQGQAPVQPKASSKQADLDGYDTFGQSLMEGDRVRNEQGKRGVIEKIVGEFAYVKWDDDVRVERTPIPLDALTKWASSTVSEFSDGVKGVKVYRYSKLNKTASGRPWEIMLNDALGKSYATTYDRYSFVNESGTEVPITLKKGIKFGEMFARQDTHELVRFAGFIDKVSDFSEADESASSKELALQNLKEQLLRGETQGVIGMYQDAAMKAGATMEEINNVLRTCKTSNRKTAEDNTSIDIHIEGEPDTIDSILDNILDNIDIPDEDKLEGGKADNVPDEEFDEDELDKGKKHEKEHTDDEDIAKEIAEDHLQEQKDKGEDETYYDDLEKMEDKEKNKKESSILKENEMKKNTVCYVPVNKLSLNGGYETEFLKGEYTGFSLTTGKYYFSLYDGKTVALDREAYKQVQAVNPLENSNNEASLKEAKSPPGRKHEVEELKEKGLPDSEAFGIAWSQENESGEPKDKKSSKLAFDEDMDFHSSNPMNEDNFYNTGDSDEFGNSLLEGDPITYKGREGIIEAKDPEGYTIRFSDTGEIKWIDKFELDNQNSRTAADISDEVPPMSSKTDKSKSDIPDSNITPLPPKDELNNAPGDVLYDSNDKNPQGTGKFQVTTDPSEKTVTVRFLDEDKEDALNNALNQGVGNTPSAVPPPPQQNQGQPQAQQGGGKPQTNFDNVQSPVAF
jgi:hypothetical protein